MPPCVSRQSSRKVSFKNIFMTLDLSYFISTVMFLTCTQDCEPCNSKQAELLRSLLCGAVHGWCPSSCKNKVYCRAEEKKCLIQKLILTRKQIKAQITVCLPVSSIVRFNVPEPVVFATIDESQANHFGDWKGNFPVAILLSGRIDTQSE